MLKKKRKKVLFQKPKVVDSQLSETCEFIIQTLRLNNKYHRQLCLKINTIENELLMKTAGDLNYMVKNYIRLNSRKISVESMFSYLSGLKNGSECETLEEELISNELRGYPLEVSDIENWV